MNPKTLPKMGQPRKEYPDSPLFHFLLKHFCRFSKKWPNQRDILRIGIVFNKADEVPSYGYHILWELCSIAAGPRLIKPLQPRPMLLSCLKASPDFTLGIICEFRRQLAKLPAENRAILYQNDPDAFTDRQKTARSEFKKIVQKQLAARAAKSHSEIK